MLALVALLVACGRRATPAPSPTPTWWTARVVPSATGQAFGLAQGTGEAGSQATTTGTPVVQQVTPSAATAPGPHQTTTPLSQPAVIGAYVTEYLPGWGERPSGMTVLGNRLYVANQRTHNVTIIAGEAAERVVPVGTFPGPMVADPASGRVFVLNQFDSTISVIEGDHVVATWELPEACSALAVAGERLWVGSAQGGRIYLLTTDDGSRLGEANLDTDSNVIAMVPSPDGAVMYVASYNRTTALDVATLAEIVHAELNSYTTLAVSADGHRVYVNDNDAEESRAYLVSLDAVTLEELGRLSVPPDPAQALAAPEGDRVYLLSSYANALLAIDGAAMALVETIPVGLDPQILAMDPASERLFVANQRGDSVTVIDTDRLVVTDTVPLSAHVDAMAVDPDTGTLYVAASNSDRVLAYGIDGLQSTWYVGRYPAGVATLPGRDQVAVLLRAEARLVLLDRSGVVAASYPTGRNPLGLTVDEAEGRIYAGDLVVELATGVTETLRVKTVKGLTAEEPPVGVAIDTRRGRAYAVASNGVPGTNGGNVAGLLTDGTGNLDTPAPGRVGIEHLLYDANSDRFYATIVRMANYGLQVSDAATLEELYSLPLDGLPGAAALSGGTHHLWVALLPPPHDTGSIDTHLTAIDTRTLGTAAEITVEGRVRSLAVDPRANLVYAAVDGTGDIVIVQDLAMPAPPQPASLHTPAPAATAVPEPTATVTAAAAAAGTPTATTAPTETPVPVLSPTPTREEPCSLEADARLQDAYRQLSAEEMGCPLGDAAAGQWAWQLFEHGDMLWHGSSGVIYVFTQDGGWRGYADEWREGMPALGCEADPPPAGLLQPVRGFGRIWCLVTEAQEGVGWGLEPERAVSGVSQEFDGGVLMRWDGTTRLLRRDGAWVAP
jgi:YVTN family beta-propeller protein